MNKKVKYNYLASNYGEVWDTKVYKLDTHNICIEDYNIITGSSIRKRYCGLNIGSLKKFYFSHVYFNMFETNEQIGSLNPDHEIYMEKTTEKCKKDLGELWNVDF